MLRVGSGSGTVVPFMPGVAERFRSSVDDVPQALVPQLSAHNLSDESFAPVPADALVDLGHQLIRQRYAQTHTTTLVGSALAPNM